MKTSRATKTGIKHPQIKKFCVWRRSVCCSVQKGQCFHLMASCTYQDSRLKSLILQKDEVHPSFNMFPSPSPPPCGSVISSQASVDNLSGHWMDQASLQNPGQVHAKGSLKWTDSPNLRGAGTHWERGCGSRGSLRRAGEIYCWLPMPAVEDDGGVAMGGRELFQAPSFCIPLHLKLVRTSVLLLILCEYWSQEALLWTHVAKEVWMPLLWPNASPNALRPTMISNHLLTISSKSRLLKL